MNTKPAQPETKVVHPTGGVDYFQLELAARVGEAADRAEDMAESTGCSDQRAPELERRLESVVQATEALAARTVCVCPRRPRRSCTRGSPGNRPVSAAGRDLGRRGEGPSTQPVALPAPLSRHRRRKPLSRNATSPKTPTLAPPSSM
jgi:hypothetical protein